MNATTSDPVPVTGSVPGAPTGTPFIAFLDRHKTLEYEGNKLPSDQNKAKIPKVFIDAMTVRKAVYVDEQGVPLEYEFDRDDSRALHWVIYSSIQEIVEHEQRDLITDSIVRPRRGETSTIALGTIRLVPFPHPAHPRSGGVYVNGELTNPGSPADAVARPAFLGQDVQPLTPSETGRISWPNVWPPAIDAATELHDGQEPYIKLGRLSVLKEYRGRGIGSQLIDVAINYMRQYPTRFDPLASKIGFGVVGPYSARLIPQWKGLFCCHAQESAVGLWEKHGFKVDTRMGRWLEEGIPHVAMFRRIELHKNGPGPSGLQL